MKRVFLNMLISLAFVLGVQVEAGEEKSGGPGAGIGAPVQKYRVFYVFSPQDPEHLLHAHELQDLARPYGRLLQVVGVVRLAEEADAGVLEDCRRRCELRYPLLDASQVAEDAELPSALKARVGQGGDYLLLVDAAGRPAGEGTGKAVAQLFSLLPRESIPTDVDESTWGKIKELFQ